MNKAALDDTQAQLMFLREMKERDHATSLEAKVQELERMLDMNHQNACSNQYKLAHLQE